MRLSFCALSARSGSVRPVFPASLAWLLAACGGATVPAGAGNDAGARDAHQTIEAGEGDSHDTRDAGQHDVVVPLNHRPNDSQCATVPDAGDCQFPGDEGIGSCGTQSGSGSGIGPGGDTDTQCTMGMNGRCIPLIGPAGCSCTYDTCTGDSDCMAGQLCACHGGAYAEGQGNTCMPGNCRVDSDCGTNGYCSPTAGGGCGGVSGYYCHTPQDQCVNDTDCGGQSGFSSCQWSSGQDRWTCQTVFACG